MPLAFAEKHLEKSSTKLGLQYRHIIPTMSEQHCNQKSSTRKYVIHWILHRVLHGATCDKASGNINKQFFENAIRSYCFCLCKRHSLNLWHFNLLHLRHEGISTNFFWEIFSFCGRDYMKISRTLWLIGCSYYRFYSCKWYIILICGILICCILGMLKKNFFRNIFLLWKSFQN